MRSRFLLLVACMYLSLVLMGCSNKPASSDSATPDAQTADGKNAQGSDEKTAKGSAEGKEHKQPKEAKREPLVVPSGTAVTIALGSQLGSKVSQARQAFSGSVAKDVLVGGAVAIPKGATVNGTVTDAKPLGKFAGGAVLQVRLDSINLKGADLPVQASARIFTAKGKGKRTAVIAGGGAALGGIIGALAGGGKGAAIGMAAGGGAGAGGAAFTGNKDIVLPAESAVSFELSQALEIKQ